MDRRTFLGALAGALLAAPLAAEAPQAGPLKRPSRPPQFSYVALAILLLVTGVPFLVCGGIIVLVSSRRRGPKLARILVALVAGAVCGALWILLVDTVVNAPMSGAMNEPAVLVVGVVAAALVAASLLAMPTRLSTVVGRSAVVVGFHCLALPIAACIAVVVRGARLGAGLAEDLLTVGVGGLLAGVVLVYVGDRVLKRRRTRRSRPRFDLSGRHP
jgi:hypothetical protein